MMTHLGDAPRTHDTLALEIGISPVEAVPHLRHLPGLVLLDSSLPGGDVGRYSYVTADPFLTLRSRGRRVEITEAGSTGLLDADPWNVLSELLGRYAREAAPDLPPFQGGAAGYLAYDLGRHLERLPYTAVDDLGLPELSVGFYDWVLARDHESERSWLIATGLPEGTVAAATERLRQVEGLLLQPVRRQTGAASTLTPVLRSDTGKAAHMQAVGRAKEHIAAGDIYQVNLTHRLSGDWSGDPWGLYLAMREQSPVPYGAFLDLDDAAVLSGSPERFLRLDGRRVETRPIKGTRPRGRTPEEDEQLATELRTSPKDRAENLMIVDLLRNDLGKVCDVGSVHVPSLFSLEGYSNVWQLVSTVVGDLRQDADAVDLLRACFPGGSITGCPKVRSMEIIEELEPVRRGIYCGSIGYLSFSGRMDTSIVIRTLVLARGRAYLQVGGGIVADSDPQAEYEESLDKARAGLSALGAWLEEW